MRISQVMTRDVVALAPTDTLQEAAQRMREADTGFIPIQENGRIIGTVTDRDICVRAVAQDRSPASTDLRSVLSKSSVCCYDDQDEEDAMEIMANNKVRRLPVLDRQDRLVGVVSLGDLANRLGVGPEMADAMEEISQPTDGSRTV